MKARHNRVLFGLLFTSLEKILRKILFQIHKSIVTISTFGCLHFKLKVCNSSHLHNVENRPLEYNKIIKTFLFSYKFKVFAHFCNFSALNFKHTVMAKKI